MKRPGHVSEVQGAVGVCHLCDFVTAVLSEDDAEHRLENHLFDVHWPEYCGDCDGPCTW